MKKNIGSFIQGISKKQYFLIAILLLAVAGGWSWLHRDKGPLELTGDVVQPGGIYRGVLLKDGRVFFPSSRKESEIYDPKTGKFTLTDINIKMQSDCSETLLPNGKVLLAGGNPVGFDTKSVSTLYDPVKGLYASTSDMNVKREQHTATLLHDGKVLIAGGLNDKHQHEPELYQPLDSAELYDYKTGKFTLLKTKLTIPRYKHSATLLQDGRVLIVGGVSGTSSHNLYEPKSAEVYNPVAQSFTAISSPIGEHPYKDSILLPDGRVIFPGRVSEIYNPKTDSFKKITSFGGATALLPTGKVLTLMEFGPIPNLVYHGNLGLYDPVKDSYTRIGSTLEPRQSASLTRLLDGRILIVGGAKDGKRSKTTELYKAN